MSPADWLIATTGITLILIVCYKLRIWSPCFWLTHDWTCKAEQGIDPTRSEIDQGVPGFYHYATMYCKRCGKEYQYDQTQV